MEETEGKLGLVLMGGAMLSKSLILFPVDGRGCEDNGTSLKGPTMHSSTECPQSCSRPPPTDASSRNSWTLIGKSRSV